MLNEIMEILKIKCLQF